MTTLRDLHVAADKARKAYWDGLTGSRPMGMNETMVLYTAVDAAEKARDEANEQLLCALADYDEEMTAEHFDALIDALRPHWAKADAVADDA